MQRIPEGCIILFSLICFLIAGCTTEQNEPQEIMVFSAASLQDALNEIIENYTAQSGVKVLANYNSSGLLAKQILSGARPDVFLSANETWMAALDESNLAEQVITFASNRLIIVARESEENLQPSLEEIVSNPEMTLAIGDPSHVPAGMYAKEALENSDVWNVLEDRMIFAVNVRAALDYALSGAADVAIVYSSDVYGVDQIVSTEIDPALHSPVRYLACTIEQNEDSSSSEFLNYLQSKTAQDILHKYGFRSDQQ